MANPNYYLSTNEGRADWWEHLLTPASAAALTAAGVAAALQAQILDDAKLGVYAYRTARKPFDVFSTQMLSFLQQILTGPIGTAIPTLPVVPTLPALPALPAADLLCGVETRRIKWVQVVKHLTGYTVTLGIALGLEAPASPFDSAAYKAVMTDLACPAAGVVAGKFRKAGGQIDAINLYGRLAGTTAFTLLKTCMTSPFTASVPLAGAATETWEFQARAVMADVEIGIASDIVTVLIHA